MRHGSSPSCLKCSEPIPWSAISLQAATACPRCHKVQEITLFSAITRKLVEESPGTQPALPEDATCYYYPENRAQYVCALSGRFICEDAATDWEGKKVSIEALLRLKREQKEKKLITEAILYDDIALSMAVLPILASLIIFPLTLVTAPVTLYIVIRYWGGGPTGLFRRSRWRYVTAFIIALLQLIGWVVLVGLFIIGLSSFNNP